MLIADAKCVTNGNISLVFLQLLEGIIKNRKDAVYANEMAFLGSILF
jgi:hypothetical protein